MSMYRQLWLAIVVSMLLAFGGSLLASLLSARSYLEQQLDMKNADNAAALALSLSQKDPDIVTVELAVSALFDRGHYESIRVIDPMNQTLIERIAPSGDTGAPDWFIRRLPLRAKPGEAQISSGWTQFGKVVLVSHSRFAYEALWNSTREMAVALALAGIVGGYMGSLILRRLRRPLQAVIEQAEAITNRRFISIPEPDVPELRQLAVAMNATVVRLKNMFDEEAARLEKVRLEANCDPLTGLANRDFFMARLRSSLEDERSTGGSLMLVRIADLIGINRRLGRNATDDLLRRIATVIAKQSEEHLDGVAARINGADFALLLPGLGSGALPTANTVLQKLIHAAEAFVDHNATAYIGLGVFKNGVEMGQLLSQVDAALAAAEAEVINTVRAVDIGAGTDKDAPKSADQWAKMIQQALDRSWVRLISFPVADMHGHLLHGECPLRLMFDAEGEWLPAGRFLPVAERLGLTPALDLAALALGLADLERQPELKGLAINLSASSIVAGNFQHELSLLLGKHPHVTSRLWIEVAETGVLKHVAAFRRLCQIARKHHCRIGVEHFGRQFSQIGQLHDLGLDYIKVDASFIRGLDANPGNQTFLKGLSGIAHNIGLMVIAEGVVSDAELAALKEIGFDGATGPAIKRAA